MDKTRQSSVDSTASTGSNLSSTTTASVTGSGPGGAAGGRDQYLRHLNKISHKIAKPTSASSSVRKPFDPSVSLSNNQAPPPPPQAAAEPPAQNSNPNQNQPPVYNISKSDFRDVVQKLTGSPAHERVSTATPQQQQPPPPIHPTPKPPSSRLQRIRPPPLSQIANRPSLLVGMNPALVGGYVGGVGGSAFPGGFRPSAPLSPLPPLPTCHAAAESPISAYMRFLHSSMPAVDADPRRIPTVPPFPAMNPQMQNQPVMPQPPAPVAPTSQFMLPPPPSSPLPFGCFTSPKSPCPLLSTNLLFSPTGTGQVGFSQLPFSPNVPAVPSPR